MEDRTTQHNMWRVRSFGHAHPEGVVLPRLPDDPGDVFHDGVAFPCILGQVVEVVDGRVRHFEGGVEISWPEEE